MQIVFFTDYGGGDYTGMYGSSTDYSWTPSLSVPSAGGDTPLTNGTHTDSNVLLHGNTGQQVNKPKIQAMKDSDREDAFIRSAKEQRERVSRIRKAQKAAEVIQGAWKKHKQKNGKHR